MRKQAILLAATAAAAIFSSSSMAAVTFYTNGYGGFIGGTGSGFPNLSYVGASLTYGTESIYPSISWGTATGSGGPFGGKSGASINVNRPPAGPADPTLVSTIPYDGIHLPAGPPGDLSITGTNVFADGATQSPAQELGNLTHWNQPINEFFGPATVDIRYFLDVYAPDNSTLLTQATGTFRLSFIETENVAGGPCPAGNPQGTFCDDIFTYTLLPGFTGTSFSYLGTTYNITQNGFYTDRTFTTLSGTFYSGEGVSSTGFVTEIKTIPEPGTLALIGAGLLGAAVTRRRRSKAA